MSEHEKNTQQYDYAKKIADELIKNLRDIRFNNDSTLEALLLDCDLLIIDDFGVEKSLEDKNASWRAEKIYNLIDSRYRCGKPLIISTNLDFDEDENRCEIARRFSAKGKNRINSLLPAAADNF